MTFVYVTDYTGNTGGLGLRPVHADWCPSNLADKMLQVEFFGPEAANFVRSEEMAKGQLWTFCNVRLKKALGDSRLEATYSEVRKAHRLKEDEKDDNPRLRELLEYVLPSTADLVRANVR